MTFPEKDIQPLIIPEANLEGPNFGFRNRKAPDFNLIRQGLERSVFPQKQWAFGPEGSPLVVASQDDHDKINYKIWMLNQKSPLTLQVRYEESLLEKIAQSEMATELKLDGFDTLSPTKIHYPYVSTVNDNGHPRLISVENRSTCRVLIGTKQVDL